MSFVVIVVMTFSLQGASGREERDKFVDRHLLQPGLVGAGFEDAIDRPVNPPLQLPCPG
jgi:hypothetical protein